MKKITLSNGISEVEIPTPTFGYKVDIHMAMSIARAPDGTLKIWDNGLQYDYRTCTAKWILKADEMQALHEMLTDQNIGRCEDLELRLGEKSGFFVFGPDKGCSNTFVIRELEIERTGRLIKPFNRYELTMKLLMRSAPIYTIASGRRQGNLTVGTVTGLPFPRDIKPSFNTGWQTDLSNAGIPYSLDQGISVSNWSTEFNLEGSACNIGKLVNYLVNSARSSDIPIIAPLNSYIFGAENNSHGTYIVALMDSIIAVEHVAFNRFKITLKVALKSV